MPIKSQILDNGVTVLTKQINWPTTAIGVHLRSGSAYETSETNGSSHFIEHMLFKGTKTRTFSDIVESVENMGAHLNAYTTRDHTFYSARSLKGRHGDVAEILSDLIQHSEFDEEQVRQERYTIECEGDSVAQSPQETLYDVVHRQAFPGHGLGMTVLGPRGNIQDMDRDQLLSYCGAHTDSGRLTLIATGAIDHDEVCRLSEQLFQRPRDARHGPTLPDAEFTPSEFHGMFKAPPSAVGVNKSHVAVSFAGCKPTDPEYGAVCALAALLATPGALAETHPFLFDFKTHNVSYSAGGFVSSYFAVPTDQVDGLIGAVRTALVKLASPDMESKIRVEDLIRSAKIENHANSGAYSFASGLAACHTLFGRSGVTGRTESMAPIIDAVEQTTPQAIVKYISDLLTQGRVSLTVLDEVGKAEWEAGEGAVVGDGVGFGSVKERTGASTMLGRIIG